VDEDYLIEEERLGEASFCKNVYVPKYVSGKASALELSSI
jgi:hypothetical protein